MSAPFVGELGDAGRTRTSMRCPMQPDDELSLIRDALRSLSGTPVKDERDQQRRMELWRELGRLIALA